MKNSVVQDLQAALGEKVLTGAAVAERYVHIWRMDEGLEAKAVVLPTTTADVAEAMRICHAHQQSVVAHGGLTNLVGSTETTADEVVIAMEKMNAIEEVDTSSRSITVQAGVILENIQDAAKEAGMLFPLNFGAKGSAQIGGIISTNAGGLRVFRFGMTRALVLGLEVVLADGTVVSSMKKIIKDNSAYDLKQLFVGSEGTLGIVTRAVLKMVERPRSRVSAFVAFDAYVQVVAFLKYLDGGLAGTLSGYELIWGQTYATMTSPPAHNRPPLPHGYAYYVLCESMGSEQEADMDRMTDLLATAMEQGMLADATLAQSEADLAWFWNIREDVHVLASQCNNDHHFDISMPIAHIGRVVDEILGELAQVQEVERAYPFGHVADGNVHFIIGKQDASPELKEKIDRIVYGPLAAVGGSVSAEHGIGVHKRDYLEMCRSEAEIQLMRTLKTALDPLDLLNRGKVL